MLKNFFFKLTLDCLESCFAIFARRVTWNYAYSPFKGSVKILVALFLFTVYRLQLTQYNRVKTSRVNARNTFTTTYYSRIFNYFQNKTLNLEYILLFFFQTKDFVIWDLFESIAMHLPDLILYTNFMCRFSL